MKLEKAQRHILKLIAIFFAVSLWFYVLNSEPEEVEKKIQVEYIIPKDYAIANGVDRVINIRVKGSKAFVAHVFPNDEKVTVDLRQYFKKFGKNFKVRFYESQFHVPFGVEILEILPKSTWVELDKIGEVIVPVKVQYAGFLPVGKRLRDESLEPTHVKLIGPMSVLKKIGHINTMPVDLAALDHDDKEHSLDLTLEELDSRVQYAEKINVKFTFDVENNRSRTKKR